MHAMDDTLADESGIPFLSCTEDIPVHSTPIKGGKVPLPSTKNVMKHLMSKPGRLEDFTDGESLQSIRHSDLPPKVKGHHRVHKGHIKDVILTKENIFVGLKNHDSHHELKHSTRSIQDLSNVDNLRQKSRNPVDKEIHYERSRSPIQGNRGAVSEHSDVFKRPKDIGSRQLFSVEDEKRILMRSSETTENMGRFRDKLDEKPDVKIGNTAADVVNSNAFSSHVNRSKYASNADQTESRDYTNDRLETKYNEHQYTGINRTGGDKDTNTRRSTDTRVDHSVGKSEKMRDPSSERRRFSINSPRNSSNFSASRTLSSSKQNTSLSELENTTLQKQRQEIQLLMGELKDRDRELSDMMTSHQQQLVAWQQDRDRLETLERKCTQYEEELRMKASQLRNAVNNLKVLKSNEIEQKKDMERFQSTVDRITTENHQYKDELTQLQGLNESLQVNIKDLSMKVGRLEAREEELTTTLRLKEKDISSATGHMKELSERLQQLDLKCKEAQDREKEAQKGMQDLREKYENSKDEFSALAAEMDHRRKELVRLAEENKSARQQLALIQKEANMMERCKDELIDSMRVKQERTDTQLRNLRELYDRQVREVASLQLQLDNSKDLIYRQQHSIDEQQLSGSYQGRLSQASEFSLERSSVSQRYSSRHKSSPSHSSRYREPDLTGSHQQTQSSGYQSQLYENQTGNQPVPNTLENNCDNITGSKPVGGLYQSYNCERPTQINRTDNQSDSKQSEKYSVLRQEFPSNSESEIKQVTSQVEVTDRRDAARELVYENYQAVPSGCEPCAKMCHSSPKSQSEQTFNSPKRKDGYIIHETTIEVIAEGINAAPQKTSTHLELSEHVLKSMERAESALTEHTDKMQSSRTENTKQQSQSVSGSIKGATSDQEVNVCDSFLRTNLNENLGPESYCDKEFEKKYTFENKLCSFLEDLDDIDDSIWDEKPAKSANVSTAEASPASKLRKLLIESQQMIESLEKSAESPRQLKGKDTEERTYKEPEVSTEKT